MNFFRSSMHHSNSVARNENIFFRLWLSADRIFISPMHHSTGARNYHISFIGGDKVPIEFLSCRNTLEAHLRPGAPLLLSPYF